MTPPSRISLSKAKLVIGLGVLAGGCRRSGNDTPVPDLVFNIRFSKTYAARLLGDSILWAELALLVMMSPKLGLRGRL